MAVNEIQVQLKQLQQEEERLAERKAQLEADLKRQAELEKKLDDLVQGSGYASPRELVKAIIDKYNLRLTGFRTAPAEKTGRRKRTRITPQLRDEIKKEFEQNGNSMNAASKKFNISY